VKKPHLKRRLQTILVMRPQLITLQETNEPLYFILNRTDKIGTHFMLETLDKNHVPASVPSDMEVFRAGFAGEELNMELPEIESIANFLISGTGV
jgi:CO dehydrogenase maturation factor